MTHYGVVGHGNAFGLQSEYDTPKKATGSCCSADISGDREVVGLDVLIVEDEAPLRESLVEGLADAFGGLVVKGANSAEEAESLLVGASPRLIVSDVRLPGKDGAALLLEVREKLPNTRFIFMSAYPSAEARRQASEHEIQFLRKPFEFTDLLEAAGRLLEEKNFSGEVGGISLVDLLQVLNLGRRSAAVSLRRRDETGRIYLEDGQVVHAIAGERKGRAAFDYLMGWEGGSFDSESGCAPPERTIAESFNGLLLDCLRTLDERDLDLDGEFEEGFLELDSPAEGSQDGPELEAGLQDALRAIPGCVASGYLDLGAGSMRGLAPADAIDPAIEQAIPGAIESLFCSEPLLRLDAALSLRNDPDPPARTVVAEIIILSENLVHHFQSLRSQPVGVLATVSEGRRNSGTVIARARQWKKSFTARDGGA